MTIIYTVNAPVYKSTGWAMCTARPAKSVHSQLFYLG